MAVLCQGSTGAAVVALQQQLLLLGCLAGDVDGAFGPATDQAVRDIQRRLLLKPDGVVGPLTQASLASAVARQPPAPVSVFRHLYRQALADAARGLCSQARLPYLDRGLAGSPFLSAVPGYADRLAVSVPALQLVPYPDRFGSFSAYPSHGVVPAIVNGSAGRGGLEFLSDSVAQACLCAGSYAADRPLRVRWYGRHAFDANVQFWSATKFIAPLLVVAQANRRSPGLPIGSTTVVSLDGSRSESFSQLLRDMVSYAHRAGEDDGSSNRIAYMFKQLLNSGEPDVQTWLRSLSGNPQALLLGWHGSWESRHSSDPPIFNPYRQGAELQGPEGKRLVALRPLPRTRNLVSAYDLVRMISMLGWHHQLDRGSRLPAAQWSSLATVVEALGHDTARYVDVALERLGLLGSLADPVILSKMGYGTDMGDLSIDALCYVAFCSFRDTRTSPARQRCFAFALRIPASPGEAGALRDDARMATEVTEIVRRIFAEELS
ncbi:MAG: peptidoglycan-binding domain-containing protein [Cyanobium sp.]